MLIKYFHFCMVHLFYYRLNQQLKATVFNQLLQTLPPFLQQKILKFRNWQDAERSLAGNLLLMHGLQVLHLEYDLQDLKYTEFQKPYFDDAIHFNIAHSGLFVICAISQTIKLGVDIEEIKPLPMEDFANLFASLEWEAVTNSENKLHAFYTLWTRKEAFLKAIGSGLSQPLNEVVIENNQVTWKKKEWFLKEIKLDAHHIAYTCCEVSAPTIKVEEIYL